MAWRVHEFGPLDVMRFERVLRPNPGPSEVLVKVEAAGVGPWDGWIRAGKSALPQPLPLTLGSDLSGEIVAVRSGVSDLRVGDQVYGVTNPRFVGAYAEYALPSSAMISRKPTSLTYIEAASVPVIAVTAWQALFDQAQLKAGQTVVIHEAAGNVGAYVVQLASHAGVRIIATAGTADIPFVRNLGAETVIDYRTQCLRKRLVKSFLISKEQIYDHHRRTNEVVIQVVFENAAVNKDPGEPIHCSTPVITDSTTEPNGGAF